MRVAITQPYLFPYIAWYQVIHACDTFVLSDHVQYIQSGYINRNQVLLGGRPAGFVAPLCHASHKAPIGERRLRDWKWARRLLRTLQVGYGRAPHFREVFPLIEEILADPADLLIDLLERAITRTSRHLGLHQRIVRASCCNAPGGQRKTEGVLALAEALGARRYLQRETDAARQLYDHGVFAARGLELNFVRLGLLPYPQWHAKEFVPGLSVIDFLMNVAPEDRERHLRAYEIVD